MVYSDTCRMLRITASQLCPCVCAPRNASHTMAQCACAGCARASGCLPGLQVTLQTMTDPNAAGGANTFLGTLIVGFAAINGALTACGVKHSDLQKGPALLWSRLGPRYLVNLSQRMKRMSRE